MFSPLLLLGLLLAGTSDEIISHQELPQQELIRHRSFAGIELGTKIEPGKFSECSLLPPLGVQTKEIGCLRHAKMYGHEGSLLVSTCQGYITSVSFWAGVPVLTKDKRGRTVENLHTAEDVSAVLRDFYSGTLLTDAGIPIGQIWQASEVQDLAGSATQVYTNLKTGEEIQVGIVGPTEAGQILVTIGTPAVLCISI